MALVCEDECVGFSPRYAYLDEQGRAVSLTKTHCHAILNGKEASESFASKRVRLASIYVELENRLPVRILQEDYAVLDFDSEGFMSLDSAHRVQSALTSSVEFLGLLDRGLGCDELVPVHAQRVLAAARWEPDPSMRRRILVACRLTHLAGAR